MNFDVTAKGLDKLGLVGSEIEEALDMALDAGAKVAENAVVRQVQKTYSRKIPVGKNGKPKWTRSGDLLREVTTQKPSKTERVIGPKGNSTKPITNHPGGYAQRLGNLPTGADGVNRSNPFAENAQKIAEKQVAAKIEQELKNLLKF